MNPSPCPDWQACSEAASVTSAAQIGVAEEVPPMVVHPPEK